MCCTCIVISEIVEPKGHSKLVAPSPFTSQTSAFGSKASAHAFGSIRSVASRADQRLAHAKPTLQVCSIISKIYPKTKKKILQK